MALTPSTMLPLGAPLPLELLVAQLTPVCGGALEPAALAGRPVLLLFLCPHCPFVRHIEAEISRLQHDVAGRLTLIGVNSNSERTHPQDGPAGMKSQALARGWTFPYLQDRDQQVARALMAACTPDLFLFDSAHRLAYRGQLDASRPDHAIPCDGRDLRAAIDAVLAGRSPDADQIPSIGCNIKWHPGQEPDWAR
jgi:thiol-disulfide isomerase/thioredoxin